MKFRLIGQRNHPGPGTHFSCFADALKKLYFFDALIEEIDAFKVAELAEAARSSADSDLNVWFCIDSRIRHFKGTNLIWAIFELEKLPPRFVEFLDEDADLVWVPSRWGSDVLEASGIERGVIDVIPEGVAAGIFHPYLRGALDRSGQPFRFLMLGKYEDRKSYPEVLDAFTGGRMGAAAVGGRRHRNAGHQRLLQRAHRIPCPQPELSAQGGLHDGTNR